MLERIQEAGYRHEVKTKSGNVAYRRGIARKKSDKKERAALPLFFAVLHNIKAVASNEECAPGHKENFFIFIYLYLYFLHSTGLCLFFFYIGETGRSLNQGLTERRSVKYNASCSESARHRSKYTTCFPLCNECKVCTEHDGKDRLIKEILKIAKAGNRINKPSLTKAPHEESFRHI